MAYNLMLEFREQPDWHQILAATRPFNEMVEYFPIPGTPPALGVSVPQRFANETGWHELEGVLSELSRQADLDVVDMFVGEVIGARDWPSIRERLVA